MFRNIGPGVLIAAAFVGPGTVTICSIAGAQFGFTLLWAMLLSVVATIVLQEMAARLGLVSKLGLAEAILSEIPLKAARFILLTIIFLAIVFGNTAYEAGNIGGATLGLESLFGPEYLAWYPWIIGGFAFALLFKGSYKILEKGFIFLVLLMSISFILTAILTKPDPVALIKGLFLPSIPEDSLLTIVALVGTTVVPYNLFLHAGLVNEKWNSVNDLDAVKQDTLVSVLIGGIVSMAIIIAASAIQLGTISSGADLAAGLEPLYGKYARYCMGIGLFAAGISSAITAPLAAAYVANSCFGWKAGLRDNRFRAVWMIVLFIGVVSLSFSVRPIEIIQLAQIFNGILLPVVAILLIWAVNRKGILDNYINTRSQNLLALIIFTLICILAANSLLKVFKDLF